MIDRKSLLTSVFFLSCLLSFCLNVRGQIHLFKSYDDYNKQKFESYDDVDYSSSSLTFKNSDTQIKFKYEEIWGFTFDKYLYRSNKSNLYQVITFGKIVSYSDGKISLKLRKGKTVFYRNPSEVATTWLSSGLNNDIYITGFNFLNSKPPSRYKSSFKKFQSDYPEYQKFYDCVEGSNHSDKLEQCLSEYNNNEIVQFDKALIDLGEILIPYEERNDSKFLTVKYTFINVSDKSIIIDQIKTSDFINSSYTKGPILPKAKGEISIVFDVQQFIPTAANKTLPKGTYKLHNTSNIEVFFKDILNIKSLTLKETIVIKH